MDATFIKVILALAAVLPAGIIAFSFWLLERKIAKNEEKREEKIKQQERLQMVILDGLNGCMRLSRASATALKRIPDAHANGDITAALQDIDDTMQRQRKLLTEAGLQHILHE